MSWFCSASAFQHSRETIPKEGFSQPWNMLNHPRNLNSEKKNQNRYIYMCLHILFFKINHLNTCEYNSSSPSTCIYIYIYIRGHSSTWKHGHTSAELTIWFGCWCILTRNKAVQLGPKSFTTIKYQSNLFNLFLCFRSVQKLWPC